MCDHDYRTSYILKEAAWFQIQEDLLSLFKSKTCCKTNAHVLSMTPGPCFIAQDGFGYLGPDHLPKCHPNFGVQMYDRGNLLEKQVSEIYLQEANSVVLGEVLEFLRDIVSNFEAGYNGPQFDKSP